MITIPADDYNKDIKEINEENPSVRAPVHGSYEYLAPLFSLAVEPHDGSVTRPLSPPRPLFLATPPSAVIITLIYK